MLSNGSGSEEERKAFALLSDGLMEEMKDSKVSPRPAVYRDQIVWGRSPVRIDLAGGWTDTPPYCLYAGGNVVNVAIELNGQPPLQVYLKPSPEYALTMRSIDMGAVERVASWEELGNYNRVGSPFSIPKAALSLAGFMPDFSAVKYNSLEEQLKDFGYGMEITLLSAIPKGSGLGTSSILAATVLGALSDFCGLGWDKNEICNRTLILEQLLTTGGGWQDPFGGVLHGLKLLQTNEGFNQNPFVRWLPDYLFTDVQYQPCHLLYYTGITRTAKDILAEIVRSMFLNSGKHLSLLAAMKDHALDMYDAIQYGDFRNYGLLVSKTWEQKKAIDTGTNPPSIEALISLVKDYALGYKLPGAGGGGYLYIVAKDPDAAARIRQVLTSDALHPNARMVEMSLSRKGLQISRS
jgi:galactokinase/mevalonate kinase-like predicted kinase